MLERYHSATSVTHAFIRLLLVCYVLYALCACCITLGANQTDLWNWNLIIINSSSHFAFVHCFRSMLVVHLCRYPCSCLYSYSCPCSPALSLLGCCAYYYLDSLLVRTFHIVHPYIDIPYTRTIFRILFRFLEKRKCARFFFFEFHNYFVRSSLLLLLTPKPIGGLIILDLWPTIWC